MVIFFFCIFAIKLFCFSVAIFDLVHDVEAIFAPSLTANSISKYFLKYER